MCAEANGFNYRAHLVRAAQHDYVQAAVELHQFLKRLEPIELRHQHNQTDEVRPLSAADFGNGFSAGVDRLDLKAIHLEQCLQVFPYARFVIDNQDFFFRSHWPTPSLTSLEYRTELPSFDPSAAGT